MFTRKLLNKICAITFIATISISSYLPVYAVTADNACEVSLNSSSILSDSDEIAVSSLATNCGLSEDDLHNILSFKVKDKSCFLVPLYDCAEHKKCFLDLFVNANADYMKYYTNGKLKSKEYITDWFCRSVAITNQKLPRSITFMIKVEDEVVGRIGNGPLRDRQKIDSEIGFAIRQSYSGQGIMGHAVSTAINFLSNLRKNGDVCYDFIKLRAIAKFDNVASNSLLSSRKFVKSETPVNDGYGLENEYFYYFQDVSA